MNNAIRPTVAWFRVSLTLLIVSGLIGLTPLAGAQPLPPKDVNGPQGVINHVCEDSYEIDDLRGVMNATLLPGVPQTHNFDGNTNTGISDKDWVQFPVVRTAVYTITTSNLSPLADTVLSLYDSENHLVAENDDSGAPDFGSQIVWRAPADASGYYYIKVENSPKSSSAYADCAGTVVSYTLSLQSKIPSFLFLPLISNNY